MAVTVGVGESVAVAVGVAVRVAVAVTVAVGVADNVGVGVTNAASTSNTVPFCVQVTLPLQLSVLAVPVSDPFCCIRTPPPPETPSA